MDNNNRQNEANINWYPGHMAKTKRQIIEKLDMIDVIIHVIDARIPKSSYIKDIEEFTFKKKKIILMSKYDLCDKKITNKWKNYYEKEGYEVILNSIDNKKIRSEVIEKVDKLMLDINKKRKQKGLLPKRAKVMIVGVSNVGKSTLINKLVNKKIAVVGNKPGVTKNINLIKIDNKIDLLDTPGVLWPKLEDIEVAKNLASMTIIKEEVLPIDEIAVHILKKLNANYKDKLIEHFGLETFDENNLEQVYKIISKHKKIPYINGEPNFDKINLIIINSIKNETIKEITFDTM